MNVRLLALLVLALPVGCGTVKKTGPSDILRQYIGAVRANQPAKAYALLHDSVRRRMTKEEFVSRWKTVRDELGDQAAHLEKRLAKPLDVRAEVQFANGGQAKLRMAADGWRIHGGINVSFSTATPKETLRALLRAVKRRDYHAVMRLMSKSVREGLEKEIDDRVKRLGEGLTKSLIVEGGRATLKLGENFKIELVKEDGRWKVADFD